MPDYTISVGGVDRTDYFSRRALRRDQSLDGKADVLTLTTRNDSWQPEDGQEIILEASGVRRFGGRIRRVSSASAQAGGAIQTTCPDWLPDVDRRLVWAAFTNMTAGAILRALFAEYAPGFTTAGVEDGPIVESINWQGSRLSEIADELAKLAGFLWRVDYHKDIVFRSRRDVLAPYAIVDGGTGYSQLAATIDRTRLVTRVTVQGGRDITDLQPYAFKGDGSTRSFGPFQFPLASQPTVLVNGVAKTIGISQVNEGKDFYWTEDGLSIEQDHTAAVLLATDTVSGQYKGYYPYRLEVDDPAAIGQVIDIEGGDGIYEKLISVSQDTPSAQARQQAQAELQQYGHVVVSGTFRTFDTRWEVGQLVTISTAKPRLNGQFLVLGVQMSPDAGWDGTGELRWQSVVSFGSTPDDWLAVFQAALRGRDYKAAGRQNDVVMRLATLLDAAAAPQAADAVTWSTYQFRRCSESLKCSEALII